MFIEGELAILERWIRERESVRIVKERGVPKPWTNDDLLLNYRWCNVRRMDDKVSKWLLAEWYPFVEQTGSEWFGAVIARMINWPDTLEMMKKYFPDIELMRNLLHDRKRSGEKVFTGAYVIPGVAGSEKIDSVMTLASEVRKATRLADVQTTMCDSWKWLVGFDGLGSFLAGQMVADLCFTGVGQGWNDKEVWAPVGPGSARGMNRLVGNPISNSVSQDVFVELLGELISILRPRIDDVWRDRKLIAMDIQNCLCEYDKYKRLSLGEGRVRARYNGGISNRQATLF